MITIFGSVNLDLIGGVERLPRPGETVPGNVFRTAPGGKGANQALAAARAGGSVRMVGAVGEDDFAAPALELLQAGRVDLASIRRVEGATGVALILVDRAGENVIAVMPGANGALRVEDAEAIPFAADDVLLLQLEVPVEAIIAAARRAKAAGAKVLLNYAPFRADALPALPHVTHLVVNESECALIAAALDIEAASVTDQATELGLRLGASVIATLGKDGVFAVEDGRIEMAAALPVQAVDTVGAGDTFCGYLAAALAEDMPLGAALALASAAGSLACTKSGAQPAIPARADVQAALDELSR